MKKENKGRMLTVLAALALVLAGSVFLRQMLYADRENQEAKTVTVDVAEEEIASLSTGGKQFSADVVENDKAEDTGYAGEGAKQSVTIPEGMLTEEWVKLPDNEDTTRPEEMASDEAAKICADYIVSLLNVDCKPETINMRLFKHKGSNLWQGDCVTEDYKYYRILIDPVNGKLLAFLNHFRYPAEGSSAYVQNEEKIKSLIAERAAEREEPWISTNDFIALSNP